MRRGGIRYGQVEPDVPVRAPLPPDPMSSDRPAAEKNEEAAVLLTTTRLRLSNDIGQPDRVVVETIAREGLAREVLLDRACPLLGRARRLLDQYADPTSTLTGPHRAQCARLADAIAALIGHEVTGQDPADELLAILAEGTPTRLTWEQIRTLPRDYQQALTPEQMPADPAVPAETPAEKAARYGRINEALERMGVEVIPPCPMAPYEDAEQPTPHVCQFCEVPLATHGRACPTESSESATPTPDEKKWGPRFGGRPYACDGCGASPHDGVYCLSPDGRHTWRPLDGPSNDELLAAPTVKKQPDDVPLADDLDPALIAALRDAGDKWGPLGVAEAAAGMTDQAALIRHLTWPKSREPAAPVKPMRTGVAALDARDAQLCREINAMQAAQEETLQARATRLDRERNDAQRAYQAAIYAADEAWRAIGGRP